MRIFSLSLVLVVLLGLFAPVAQAGVGFSLYNVGGSCSGVFFWGTHDKATATTLLARVVVNGTNISETLQKVEAGKVAFFTLSFPAFPPETLINVSLSDGSAPASIHSYTCSPDTRISDPHSDIDGDGIKNLNDNCIFRANPKQEDGWGSFLGDACEAPFDSSNGAKVFPQKDNTYHVYGNCRQDRCVIVAKVDPALLSSLKAGEFRRFQTAEGEGWFVDAYFIGLTDNGRRFYQLNIYQNGGILLSDRFTFRV